MLFLNVTVSMSRFIFSAASNFNCLIIPLDVRSKHSQHTYLAKMFNERVTDLTPCVKTIRKHFFQVKLEKILFEDVIYAGT